MIHKYMYENKVPDESCMPYQGMNMGCQADTVCRNCAKDNGCWAVPDFIGYGVSSYTVGQQSSAAYGGLAERPAIQLGSATVLATFGISAFVLGALGAFAVQAPRYWRVRESPLLG